MADNIDELKRNTFGLKFDTNVIACIFNGMEFGSDGMVLVIKGVDFGSESPLIPPFIKGGMGDWFLS